MQPKEKIVFPIIYALYIKPSSQCEFFKIIEKEGYYIAWCNVVEKPIVKDSVIKCEKFWKTCPFRKTAIQLSSETQQ